MKFIAFIKSIFYRKRKRVNEYSDAIAEGMKDTMKELGYSPKLNNKPIVTTISPS